MRRNPRWILFSLAVGLACAALAAVSIAQSPPPTQTADLTIRFFAPRDRPEELALEKRLIERVDRQNLARLHELLAREPHAAGTPGDERVVDAIEGEFKSLGLTVEKHPFWALLARPISAQLQIVAPVRLDLAVDEPPIPGDPYSTAAGSTLGWNAYSGSGEATGEVVYANYGRKEDFEKLRELGVDVQHKIVIARYGGNFRGFKAKFAEEAGAAGLIIFTDPRDSGYMQGLVKPEGGWAPPEQIQRGSLKTLPYEGDPLTPGKEATRDAERLDQADLALPKIPVQPIGYGAASEILSRMTGEPVPGGADGGWQGGLPFTYRLSGGPDLRVRLHVEQQRDIVKSHNVIATIPGSEHPEEMVIIGSHHDAWVHGAMDPLAGAIVVLEAARLFADQLRQGWRPKRSIVFAAWGAEEYGIIGSTEWVESRKEALGLHGVSYLNLDGAARGLELNASASPMLKSVILDAARSVPFPSKEGHKTLLDEWRERKPDANNPNEPAFGNLGGGSDHVAFYCHVGVPSAGIMGGGQAGDTYHSLYDNVYWYKRILHDDYAAAEMITRVVAVATARMADALLPPFDATRIGGDFARHVRDLAALAIKRGATFSDAALLEAAQKLDEQAQQTQRAELAAIERGDLSADRLERLERLCVSLGRLWIRDDWIGARPWYRNMFAATDADSGYAPWMLPPLREAIERNDPRMLHAAEQMLLEILEELRQTLIAAAALAG